MGPLDHQGRQVQEAMLERLASQGPQGPQAPQVRQPFLRAL